MDEPQPLLPPTPGSAPEALAPPVAGFPVPTLPSVPTVAATEPTPIALPDAAPGASPWASNATNGSDAPVLHFAPATPERRSRKPLMLAIAAVSTLAVGVGGFFAFGTGSDTGNEDATVRYVPGDDDSADAFSFSTATTSLDIAPAMRMTIDLEAPGMSAEMTAETDRASRRSSMRMDATGNEEMLGFDFSEFVVVSDAATATTYLSGNSYASFFAIDTDWVSFTVDDGGGMMDLDEFFDQPLDMASVFVGLEPVDLGVEMVDGEQLKHFEITMTIDQLLAQDPGALEGYGSADFTQLDAITYDVWVSEASLLRRVSLDVEVVDERVLFDMRIEHLDEPLEIALPDPSDVTDWETLMAESAWNDIDTLED